MIIRILGIIIGLCFIATPFLDGVDRASLWTWVGPFMGIAFIAYGLGGQRWLAKVAPGWAKRPDKDPT